MSILKYSIVFLLGAGTGAGIASLYFARKCDQIRKQADADLAATDEYYQELCEKCGAKAEDDLGYEDDIEDQAGSEIPHEKRQGSFATAYGNFYKEQTTDPAEKEHPEEEEEVIREKQPPKIISGRYFGMDNYSTRVLYYYTVDDALIPEGSTYEDIIDTDEVKDMIGNSLDKYGFSDQENDEREIYVRNFDRKTDYHIIKVVGSLSEDYGG